MPCPFIAPTSFYRTYIIGRANHFWGAKDIGCANDHEAIQKVQETMDGRDVELWERPFYRAAVPSIIARFDAARNESQISRKVMGGKAVVEQVTVEQAVIGFDYNAAAEMFPSRANPSPSVIRLS